MAVSVKKHQKEVSGIEEMILLNELKTRGVEDILICCVDNLSGFSEAIIACYPDTEIQKCVVHQIHNSISYVSYKDTKKLLAKVFKIIANKYRNHRKRHNLRMSLICGIYNRELLC